MQPTAVVLNMYYTGLGVARSLGERGVPVIGLSAQPRLYGNLTRYATVLRCPDSRSEPRQLADYLLDLGSRAPSPFVLFPTRDHDIVMLERYRDELSRYFSLVIPTSSIVQACLDKWETHGWAVRAGVPVPKAALVESVGDLEHAADEVGFPCVLKPVTAYSWRQAKNWDIVGGRKAIGIESRDELFAEYRMVGRTGGRVIVEQMIRGADDQLFVAAGFFDAESRQIAGFTARKRVQVPEGFGTGCIVETADCPEVAELAARLLRTMAFSGIAEVEFKREKETGEFRLIEINPRPWDQHRLGEGRADVIYAAYCEHARLKPRTDALNVSSRKNAAAKRWIAEDAFCLAFLRSIPAGGGQALALLRAARGDRIFAIWAARDPLPSIAWTVQFCVTVGRLAWGYAVKRLRACFANGSRCDTNTEVHRKVNGLERSKG